jgi:GGDEF domain-containing protein
VEAGYRIQFSVGQVQFNAVRHRTVDELLADADAAMYVNKTAIRREIQDR